MPQENKLQNEAVTQPTPGATDETPPTANTATRKLFSVYDMAGEGGLTQKGLGIFILCASIAVVAFIIYAALH